METVLLLTALCTLFAAVAGVGDDSVRFLVIGDWGGLPYSPFSTAIERAIAKQMAKVSSNIDSQFLLALGDNFYFDGVVNVHDPRFHETYEDVFTHDSLQTPWYLVAGNHDHRGNVTAQILYSQVSKRWNYPDYYYTMSYPIPNSKKTVRFVMIDTILLCGVSDTHYLGEPPLGAADQSVADKQWLWIEQQLSHSKDDYLIVAGHYPVYSIAEHGPTDCLIKQLDPMLHKYNVSAFMSGHDHNLQHLVYTDVLYKTKMDYFVIGSANFIDNSIKHKNAVPKGSLKFHWADTSTFGGFAKVLITPHDMTLTLLRANGVELYQKTIRPRF
ncbi:tartrate-resistant acid phosphatase type 5-like [Lineus longissimus]|uniref:tartrate-resistant acid phosphatase type 5-like n=1 Tax=Lineus longissimus TaxID=88925 RepID=UPI002B4DBD8E